MDDYFHNLSMKDKYTKKPTDWELSQLFSDCRDLVLRLKQDIEEEIKCLGVDNLNRIFKLSNRILHLNKFINMTKPHILSRNIDIPKAKNVPIQELYDFNVSRETSKRMQAKCPFHEEKVGSFFISKDNNKFHCFSCGSKGDSIDFIMKLKHIDFIEAVKLLQAI